MSECICEGNWRKIVAESEALFGKTFVEARAGRSYIRWTLAGIVHAEDDYYYLMTSDGQYRLLSCVSNLDGHGYFLLR